MVGHLHVNQGQDPQNPKPMSRPHAKVRPSPYMSSDRQRGLRRVIDEDIRYAPVTEYLQGLIEGLKRYGIPE